MKYKLLRFSLLSLLVMLCGSMAMAEDEPAVTLDFTSQDNWDIPTDGTNKDLAEFTDGTYKIKLYATTNYKLGKGYLLLGKKDSYLQLPAFDFDVEKIVIEGNSGASASVTQNIYVGDNAVSKETTGAKGTNTYEIADGSQAAGTVYQVRVTNGYNTQITKIHIYKAVADTRTATTVTISDPVQEGTVGESLPYPEVFVINETTGAAISGATVVWESSDPTVASIDRDRGFISLLAAGTTTISATYEGDDTYKGSEASYKLNVYDAPIASLKDLQEAATTTGTPVTVKFNNVFVTGVSGSNAYIADADGYGALVYQSGHGLVAGNVLNGTISSTLLLYKGQTELKGFSKEGLEITNTELTPTVKTLDAITAANQSTLVTLKGVTCVKDGEKYYFTDGTKTIQFYDAFGTEVTPEEGKDYDVTGVVIVFNTTLEIAPRTAADLADAVIPPLYVIGNISSGDWDRTAMDEIPYNATNNAYEKEFTTEGVVYFAFATKQLTAEEANADMDWSMFNKTYRLGAGDGGNISAIFGEPMALSHGDKTVMISSPGDYKLSVSKDMSSVTFTKATVPTYTSVIIAGDAAFLGSVWDPEDANNKMEKQDDGTFKKVYTNVEITEASTFEYKLVFDGEWLGGDNLTYTFEKAGKYNVTFTFNPATDKIECVAEAVGADADPYEYTFEAKVFDAAEQTKELNGVNWTLATDADYFGYDSGTTARGQQIGSSKAAATTIALSTSEIKGTVKKVVVNTSGAASINATVKVTVGDAIFTYEGEGTAKLTETATEYVFEGSSAGDITISYTNNSAKAIYIKSIQVNPADAPETYEITLAKDMISFSCDKELDFSEVEGLTAYIVVGGTANTAKLQEVAQVPAKDGVILQGKAGTTYKVPVINIATPFTFNFLYSTWSDDDSKTTVAARSAYVLSDGTFKLFTGTEIESGKAYLNKDEVGSKTWLAGGEDATATARTIGIEGDATGIDSVTREALSNGKIYNLQGQEVKNATKGVFIVNGKKVLVP